MELKSSLFSTIFSSRPVKAKSVEFMLTQSRCNTIQKYVLHFQESFRNLILVRTSYHTKKYSRKMHQSLGLLGNLEISASKKKKFSNSVVESWPVENHLQFSLVKEGLAVFCHWVLPSVSLCLDFTYWPVIYNGNPFLSGNSLGCFELKINWEEFWLLEDLA